MRQIKGTRKQSSAEDTRLFLLKIIKLNEIWEKLKLFLTTDKHDNIIKLQENSKSLTECVKKEGSLNAGGKFEWVDSLLIKCLQDGSWLLIENVNLCSSAVLDRLNALLEPHGVLTVSERGVDEHGQMVEIKPHKDFRLFLTMDPKNGEISRAMRNRGVEIYILNEQELGGSNELDVKSLINLEGLKETNHVNTLTKIHHFLCEMASFEKPHINEILQASSLISQQINNGMDVFQAFSDTIIEVYYNKRSSDINVINDKIKQELDDPSNIKDSLEAVLYNENVSLKTQNLEIGSDIEKVKQQAVLIQNYININNIHASNFVHSLLINYYSITSVEDLEIRHLYLQNCLNNSNSTLILELAEKLYNTVLKYNNFEIKNLPLDGRWTPEIPNVMRNSLQNNKFILALYICSYYFKDLKTNNGKSLQEVPKSLLDYMHARKKKSIENKFNDVIINEYLDLIEEFDKYLMEFPKHLTIIKDEEVVELLYLVFWRYAFHRCTLVNIRRIDSRELHCIIINLCVHYKWFLKNTVERIKSVTRVDITENLKSIISRINKKVEVQYSFIQNIGKCYQKCNDKPLPFISKTQLEEVKLFNDMCHKFNICARGNNAIRLINILNEDKEIRPLLIDLRSELKYEVTDTSKKITIFKSLEEKSVKYDENQGEILSSNKFEIQLIPILDYFTQIIIRTTMKNFPDIESEVLKNNVLIPPELSSVLICFSKTKDYRLFHEITASLYSYLINSASVKPIKYLKYPVQETEEIILNGFQPKLTFYLCYLLLSTKDSNTCGSATLGNFRDLMKQHNHLNLLLWRNLYQLSEENYDYMLCEKEYIRKVYEIFIKQLASSLNVEETSDTLQETTNKCVNAIKEIEKVNQLPDPDNEIIKITKRLQKCSANIGKLTSASKTNNAILIISDLYMEVSYIKAVFNSKLPLIDTLVKKKMKKSYYIECFEYFTDINKSYELVNQVFSNTNSTIHGYYVYVKQFIEKLKMKIEKLDKHVAYRPTEVLYEDVLKEVNHAFTTVLSEKHIDKVTSKLTYYILNLIDAISKKENIDHRHFSSVLRQHESTVISYENLIFEWNTLRNSYPDIIEPLLSNIVEFLYGLKMKLTLFKKLLMEYKHMKLDINVKSELINLVKLPSLDDNQNDYSKMIEVFSSKRFTNFIDHIFEHEDLPNIKKQEKFRLLKCGLHESFNHCLIEAKETDTLNKNVFMEFNTILDLFVSAWNKQEEEKEIKEKEAESLYKIKSKCDKPEEEQAEEELKELFPNFHTIDFADLQKSVDVDEPEEYQPESDYKGVISYNDLKFVVQLHTLLVQNFTRTEWLNPSKDKTINQDFVTPLIEKYNIFKQILDKSIDYLDYTMDTKLIASLNVLLAVKQKYGDINVISDPSSPSRHIKNRNFYKESNVDEVKSCYHIIEELRIKINELLDEWSDQPTLKSIILVIDRIFEFDITSPVSRFLTGFEILLSKCHEWEEVAHSGVSLSQYFQNITQQIISWRKLELSMWKDLLNHTYDRLNEPLAKWWLYMFNIMEQFIVEKKITNQELIEPLQTFITKSNLAEFDARLELIYVFHCHATFLDRTKETQLFISILWNIYSYFKQYSLTIANKIKDLRSPVEKKLKDYIKIVKWKDISYWSVKETVDKTHKTLHKYMKEFQDILQQPVTPYLVNIGTTDKMENVGIWDRPQRQSPKTYHYTLDAEAYMAKQSLIKKYHSTLSTKEEGILSKTESYFLKSRKLCKDTILATHYPSLVQSLDGFVTEIIDTSTHLQNLEVDSTLSKEKQKTHAKSILQQKHRSLADLFKNLSKLGLSFRTGIVESKLKNPSEDFTFKPINLNANFSHINYGRKEEKILTIWDSCEIYYVRSLMRIDVMETALKNPAPDLGLQNIERCKGFSSHLMSLAQKQKLELIDCTRLYYYLRFYVKHLSEFCEGNEFLHFKTIKNITELLKNITIVMNQCKIILNSCPVEDSLSSEIIEIPVLKSKLKEIIEYKNDELWLKASNLIKEILSLVNKINLLLHKCQGYVPSIEFDLIYPEFVPISKYQVETDLFAIYKNIDNLKKVFGNTAINDSLSWIINEIGKIGEQFEEEYCKEDIFNVDQFKKKTENLYEKILIIMQNIYKKYTSDNPNSDKKSKESSEVPEEEQLQEDHLKNLVENLSTDMSILEMKNVLKVTHKISSILLTIPPKQAEEYKAFIFPCLPLLEQLVQLYQYFITQQVSAYRVTCKMNSILLNIFINLVSKGFCTPQEFSGDLDDDGISKPSDGLGLGEGQGEKDVSDKIETEDQLDDAQPADQEKETEEKDCEEEEKGIDMSEDFDSKLQDTKQKEGDDDESSNDSDASEQMGETEKGANQLDEEIWGSDKEDDTEDKEESNQEEEKGDKGEKIGEDQISANEKDRSKGDKDENDKNAPEEKENKKEINEMNEPEFDDDQIDPHHGKQPELPEPEPMDLPDDLQLDEGQEKDNENENQGENPFDIDTMKEENLPDEKKEQEKKEDDSTNEGKDFSSDEDEITRDAENDIDDDEEDKNDKDNKDRTEGDNKDVEDPSDNENEEGTKEGNEETVPENTPDLSQSNQENIEAMNIDNIEGADKTEASKLENKKSSQPVEELCQEDAPDKEGVGQSQMEETKSGHSAKTTTPQDIKGSKRQLEDQMKQQKPGESDSQRSLGDVNEPAMKRLKTSGTTLEEIPESEKEESIKDDSAEMYQHIKEAKETTTQILDVATKEQAESQKIENKEDDDKTPEISTDLHSEEEPEDVEMTQVPVEKSEELDTVKEKKSSKKQHPEGDVLKDIQDINIEGDLVDTITVSRPTDSTHHTQLSNLIEETATILSFEDINNLRSEVETQLSSWNDPPSTMEAEETWQKISSVTSSLARDLSEQLRLVLEPTQASRLKGDFRTGRRINMRKVIPYIASQFRKDKIWMRRTKPSKRDYQIVLAIDDSSSMADNHSKELAFESVSLISKALTLLESGELAVLSFGETTEVIHKLTDQFTDKSGVKLLQKFKFDQNKTCIAKLVDFATEMFNQTQTQSIAINAKLLVVISDGRGVFSEGETYIRQAVRRAKLSNIFMIFIIIDNPENKHSILDIRMPVFKDGKVLNIQTYMDVFPFSFYIILRDINSLPNVLSDALRQWFEIVSNLESQ